MKVIYKKNQSMLTTIVVGFQAGSALESQNDFPAGTAHYLEHMMFKGTKKRDSFAMSREIAFHGGDSNAYTSHEQVCFFVTIPSDKFGIGVEILHDMLTDPLFPQEEFEKERQVILEEHASLNESIYSVMSRHFMGSFFSNYLSKEIIGTEESINSITLDDVKRFYNSFYNKENMVISVCSNLKKAVVLEALEKYFGEQDNVFVPLIKEEPTSLRETKVIKVVRGDLEQDHVLWGWESSKLGEPDSCAEFVLASILGDGMDSRLFQQVRERSNLVYGIGAGNSANRSSGYFVINFSTRHQNLEEAKKIILAEVDKIMNDLPTDEELQRSKNKMLTGVYRAWQSPENSAMKMLETFINSNKIADIEKTRKVILAVTKEDVNRVAKKVFGGNNVMVLGVKEKS